MSSQTTTLTSSTEVKELASSRNVPKLVGFRRTQGHTESYTEKLEQIMARMPVHSDKLPLPYSEVAVYLNCACPAFIDKQKVDPACPIFQLAWFALNGLLREDMAPASQIVPDKDKYFQALSFLKTVGADPAVLANFESFYVVKVFVCYSRDNIREVFEYFSSVTLETKQEYSAVVYKVYSDINTVEIFYPAYGSDDGTVNLDGFVKTLEAIIQDNVKAATDATVEYHTITFGPADSHIYE